jgi:hypothetical protein
MACSYDALADVVIWRRARDPSPVPFRLVKTPAAGHPLPKGEGSHAKWERAANIVEEG